MSKYTEYPITQASFAKVVKKNYKIEKKLKGVYLWNGDAVAQIIFNNMVHEAARPERYIGYAYFLAYRLKFADAKTISLVQDAVFAKKKHYTEKIAGNYTIFETMQINNCDYFQALYIQYRLTDHFKNSKMTRPFLMPDVIITPNPIKVKCSYLSEDGSHICYMKQEDWETKYGPVDVMYDDYDSLSQEMKDWIERLGQPIGPMYIGSHAKPSTDEERRKRLLELKEKYGIK